MKTVYKNILIIIIVFTFVFTSSVFGREAFTGQPANLHKIGDKFPFMTIATHDVGKIALTVTNFGIIGTAGYNIPDPITGYASPSLSYPQGYGLNYLSSASLWIGAVAGPDTLVSAGNNIGWGDLNEFFPLPYPEGDIIFRSNNDPEAPEYEGAVSNQDFITTYYDTFTEFAGVDYFSGETHNSLGIKVIQRSYAWGYDYAEDFILFDYSIVNIGNKNLEDVYIGIYVDNDCGVENTFTSFDDICGFLKSAPSRYIDGLVDTIDIAWAADNNGDPNEGGNLQGIRSPTSIIGTKILRTPSDSINFTFNWWVSNFFETQINWGPRKQSTGQESVRTFFGVLGTPFTDSDKYYVMSQSEFDYNQEFTRNDHSLQGWLPPPSEAATITNGADIKYLVSCGPFDFKKGDVLPFTFAIVGGQDYYYQDFRINPFGYVNFRNPDDLALNTVWATWVYDNPGYDTDGDGFRGKYYIKVYDSIFDPNIGEWVATVAETLYYKGDGVPDFRGATPPPPPKFTLHPRITEKNTGEIEIRWNGRVAETSLDQFSQRADFEGYRIYISISDRDEDFVLVSSYDKENYNRWEYHRGFYRWELRGQPYDIRTLKAMYGENFNPLEYYDHDHIITVYNESLGDYEGFYFTRHDWNQFDYRDTIAIHKVYPDQPYPSTLDLDSAVMFYPDELTAKGELKYFEYRYVLRDLLVSMPYYISVTAFDHGYPERELSPQETSPTTNAIKELAQNSATIVEDNILDVYVYPNPYRIDANYDDRFEGWEYPDRPKEYNRALNFGNLPHKCTIRIFSLDGDLIREIQHDKDPGDPMSSYEKWDMISRNTQYVVGGIYYYSVESRFGNQVGKFVIIR